MCEKRAKPANRGKLPRASRVATVDASGSPFKRADSRKTDFQVAGMIVGTQ